MHLTSLQTLTRDVIERIIDRSIEIKKNPAAWGRTLEGKKLYMLFQKTSTRTALAFGLGMNELGGIYFHQKYEDSNFTIGDVQDEIRYVGRNVDIVMARLKYNDDVELFKKYSNVPIINGCCNKHHPSQALADLMTIKERFGNYKINLMYIGIFNNVLNSLIQSLPKLDGKLFIISPLKNEAAIDDQIKRHIKENKNISVIDHESLGNRGLREAVKAMNVVYVDTWVDMEFFNDESYQEEKNRVISKMLPYQLTREVLKDSEALVFHDMPIHSGFEIERDVVEDHIDTILHQAENRRHVAKGIILECLGLNG